MLESENHWNGYYKLSPSLETLSHFTCFMG